MGADLHNLFVEGTPEFGADIFELGPIQADYKQWEGRKRMDEDKTFVEPSVSN
jgi:hypothetical protein